MRAWVHLSIVVLAAGCSTGERGSAADSAAVAVADSAVPAGDGRSAARLAADSVGITSRGGEVLLSVAHDSVSMGFSPATLEKIRRDTDTASAGKGIAGMIERTVKSGVQSMLSKRIMVPLADVDSVRYEDGAIHFVYRDRPNGMKLEDVKVDDRPVLESFSEPDARLFVSAVRARLRLR